MTTTTKTIPLRFSETCEAHKFDENDKDDEDNEDKDSEDDENVDDALCWIGRWVG